jgi:ubiquinone/menaquinone biosynthesis C-methylase UbiE
MFGYVVSGVANRLARPVLGEHPRNTICSFNYSTVRHVDRFLEAAARSVGGRDLTLLDIGAGKCPYFRHFESKTAKYVAVDPDVAIEKKDARIERRVGFAECLPASDGEADGVICNQVLEHVNDPDLALAEVRRVLKPGGFFFGSVPHISPVHLEPWDYRRYTDLGLRQLLERHGFEQIRIEGNGGVYSSAAFLIAMDLVLSDRKAGDMAFSTTKAFWLAPLVGFLNFAGMTLDALLPTSGRSSANLCWTAIRP